MREREFPHLILNLQMHEKFLHAVGVGRVGQLDGLCTAGHVATKKDRTAKGRIAVAVPPEALGEVSVLSVEMIEKVVDAAVELSDEK